MKRNESDKGCSLSYRNRILARSCSTPSPWKRTSKRCIESNSVGVSVEKIINFLISGSRIEAVVAYAKTSYKEPVRVQSSVFRFSVGTTRRNRSFPEFSVRSSEAKLPLGTAPSRFLHAKARVTITIQITRQLVTCACLTALINERKRQTWRRELDFFLCRCREKEKKWRYRAQSCGVCKCTRVHSFVLFCKRRRLPLRGCRGLLGRYSVTRS